MCIRDSTDITRIISTYTDSGSLLGDLDWSSRAVSSLGETGVAAIVEKAALPEPIGTLLEHNLEQQVFSPLGNLATNVDVYKRQRQHRWDIQQSCRNIPCVLHFDAGHGGKQRVADQDSHKMKEDGYKRQGLRPSATAS